MGLGRHSTRLVSYHAPLRYISHTVRAAIRGLTSPRVSVGVVCEHRGETGTHSQVPRRGAQKEREKETNAFALLWVLARTLPLTLSLTRQAIFSMLLVMSSSCWLFPVVARSFWSPLTASGLPIAASSFLWAGFSGVGHKVKGSCTDSGEIKAHVDRL